MTEFDLEKTANAWKDILERLVDEIQTGYIKVSSYTRGEGPEGDSITYGYKIFYGNYRFRIECFYPSCHPKALRRLIVDSKERVFFRRVARFDVTEMICLDLDLHATDQLRAVCVKIHDLLEQRFKNRETDALFRFFFVP